MAMPYIDHFLKITTKDGVDIDPYFTLWDFKLKFGEGAKQMLLRQLKAKAMTWSTTQESDDIMGEVYQWIHLTTNLTKAEIRYNEDNFYYSFYKMDDNAQNEAINKYVNAFFKKR